LRVKIVLNPTAGGGRAAAQEEAVVRAMQRLGVEFDIERTGGPGDAVGIARAAARSGYDVVAAMGGDGTVNEVVNGIADTGAALALIPSGTGNDFRRAVDVPGDDPEAACAIIARGKLRAVDLCRVNDRYFISSFGTGFDAAVTHRTNSRKKRLPGIWNYIFALIQVILTYRPAPVIVRLDRGELNRTPLLCAATNARTIGGGMMICPDAEVDDGLFDVCIVDNIPLLRFARCFSKVMDGSHTSLKEVEMYKTSRLTIECSAPQVCHVEGETFFSDRLELSVERRAINVVVGGE